MWHIPNDEEHNHIDGRTHEHHIHMVNDVTGGQHDIILRLGVDSCPHCKRPYPKDDLGQLDHIQAIQEALEMLEKNHAAVMDYAAQRGIPIKVGPLHSRVPNGHRLAQSGKHKMLIPPRKQDK